jgi:arabinofuranan 3-O-arabinosyltransferase
LVRNLSRTASGDAGQGALLLALPRRRFSSIGRRTKQYLDGGLFGGSLSLFEQRLLLAGGLLGLLIHKLQLGLLIPVALLAGQHWHASEGLAVF